MKYLTKYDQCESSRSEYSPACEAEPKSLFRSLLKTLSGELSANSANMQTP